MTISVINNNTVLFFGATFCFVFILSYRYCVDITNDIVKNECMKIYLRVLILCTEKIASKICVKVVCILKIEISVRYLVLLW